MTIAVHYVSLTLGILLQYIQHNRLSNAADVTASEVAFIANIHQEEYHYCIGSYILTSWVLTTAACASLIQEDMDYVQLSAGDLDLQKPTGIALNVTFVVVHKSYEPMGMKNNVGLAKVFPLYEDEDLEHTSTEYPLISVREPVNFKQVNCSIYGWFQQARKGGGGNRLSSYIKKSTWTFYPSYECNGRLGKTGDLAQRFNIEQMACGRDEDCISDDGAPVVCNGALYGLLSSSHCDVAIIIKISYFKRWIKKSTKVDVKKTTVKSVLSISISMYYIVYISVCINLIII